jgi:lysophospholipase L1-like esterase
MNWETLLCLGDSITIGARSYLGYPEHCGAVLQRTTGRNWNVANHAVSGFTTIDLARSLDERSAAFRALAPGLITLMIGTNDLKGPTAIDDLDIAYTLLVTKVGLIIGNSNVLLLEIPPIQDGVMLPYRGEMAASVGVFNERIRSIGQNNGFRVERFITRPDDFFDGVHPGPVGVERWGGQLAEMIMRMRRVA